MKRTALKRGTPLKRTRINSVRAKARPGRLKGEDMNALRQACFERDRGICQRCGRMTNPNLDPMYAESYHMAHIKAKRNGGDSLDNVRTLCQVCHSREHAYGPSGVKPCPRKDA